MKESWAAQALNIAYLTFLALLGILARHANTDATHINGRALAMACLTAPALGIIAGGVAQWAGVPLFAQSAIVALVGFLGPAFVSATAERISEIWLKKSGG